MRSRWLLLAAGLLVGCPAKDKNQVKDDKPRPSSPLVSGLEAAVAACKLAPAGLLYQCSDKALVPRLERLERAAGKAGMATYCQMLGSPKPAVRLAAAFRLDVMHARAQRPADDELTSCLFKALAASKAKVEHRVLGRTLGYLAPKAGATDKLLTAVAKKTEAQRAVYSVLWDGGRGAVVPKLEAAMKAAGADALLRRVLVRSLNRGAAAWTPADLKAGCPLLLKWARDKRPSVARPALLTLARRCPPEARQVVAMVKAKLPKSGGVMPVHISALKTVGVRDGALRPEVVALLAPIVKSADYRPGSRTLVLRNLALVDEARARALAKPLARSNKTPEPLLGEAKKVLATEPKVAPKPAKPAAKRAKKAAGGR